MDDTAPQDTTDDATHDTAHDTTQLDDLYDAPADEDEAPDEETRSRHRHPLDLFSLVTGLLALVGAALYLLGELTDADVQPALVVAAAVVVLGAAGVLVAVRRDR